MSDPLVLLIVIIVIAFTDMLVSLHKACYTESQNYINYSTL